MEGASPVEMPQPLLSCARPTRVFAWGDTFIPRSRESPPSLPLKGDALPLLTAQSALRLTYTTAVRMTNLREREEDMARKKSGKRGTAIIVLMVVAPIAGSPSTAAAATSPRPLVTATAPAPVLAVQTPVFGFENASWAEASWAEE